MMPKVQIIEVGPRDGLQNEKVTLAPDERVALIKDLAKAGLREIEAGSFVSPRWVPQMAGTSDVLEKLGDMPGISLPVLVPNLKGLELAVAAGAQYISLFVAATDGFARANLNASREQVLETQLSVAMAAREAGIRVRGSISVSMVCPFEGVVKPEGVVDLLETLCNAGCEEVALCDTTGRGSPEQAAQLAMQAVNRVGAEILAAHMHDTGELALENTAEFMRAGVTKIDAAVGGLGGCPYSPGAKGNLSTNVLVKWLHEQGYETNVDLKALDAIADRLTHRLAKQQLA